MGHLRPPHDATLDPFDGVCPYHGDCLEGLASGPAIEARWGQRAETLPPDHPAWELEAGYLAAGLVAYICTLSPQRIVMGGGVMQQAQIFPLVRRAVQRLLGDYVQSAYLHDRIEEYIIPALLGPRAGVLGAIGLAQQPI
jgi:fructokinase